MHGARPPLEAVVDTVIEDLSQRLVARQRTDGSWASRVETNVSHTALHFLALHYLDAIDVADQEGAVRALLRRQGADGGWSARRAGGPSDPSLSVRGYAFLRLAGLSAEHPPLRRARRLVKAAGGMEHLDVVTRTFLGFLGLYPFAGLPVLPALPLVAGDRFAWLPGIDDMSAILRGGLLAYGHLHMERAVRPREGGLAVLAELARRSPSDPVYRFRSAGGWYRALRLLIDLAEHATQAVRSPLRPRLLTGVAALQEASGLFGGTAQTTALCLMALDDGNVDGRYGEPIARGLGAFDRLLRRDADEVVAQPFTSATWDTAQIVRALAATGDSRFRDVRARACAWLLRRQTTRHGFWQQGAPGVEPGGWAFDETNTRSPDTDTTQATLRALSAMPASVERDRAVSRGLDWQYGLQCRCGGWAAFGRDRGRFFGIAAKLAEECTPIADVPSADLTALVVGSVALDSAGRRAPTRDRAVKRALGRLRRTQSADGSWSGRWGVNHVYATTHVLHAAARLGVAEEPWIRRARAFLLAAQNAEGGWGESTDSYRRRRFVPGPSGSVLTAAAIQSLVAAGDVRHPAVRQAVRCLCRRARPAPRPEPEYVGTISPGREYYDLDLLHWAWPLKALAEWRIASA